MKKGLIKIVALSATFALGIGLAINTQKQPVSLEATQHSGNFAAYTYSGSYYNSLDTSGTDGLNGTFRKALTSLIYPAGFYIYSGGGSDHLSGVLQSADADPTNSSNMVMFYTRDSIKKTAATVNGEMKWNREHIWPQSLSINNSGTQCWGTEEAGTDILHLRPTYETANSARGNLVYGDVKKSNPKTYNGMTYGYASGSYFEPLDELKGDVARILMYVYTTYTDHYNGLSLLKTIQNYDTLIKWHTMDEPDALEGGRNNYCETSKQKNRNPFVDHPEYAWKVFGNSCSQQVKDDCMAKYPGEGGQGQGGGQSGGQDTPVTKDYTITFKNNGSDDGSLVTESNYTNQVTSNTLVESISNPNKVYPGATGLKFGSSSATGSITFNLKAAAKDNVDSIIISATQYKSESTKFVLKANGQTIDNNIAPGEEKVINLSSPSTINTISLESSGGRIYLNALSVHKYEQSGQGGNASEPPVDSSSSQTPDTSEIPEDSSESAPYSEPTIEPQPEEKGCSGSIVTSLSLVSLTTLMGLIFIFSKKKTN